MTLPEAISLAFQLQPRLRVALENIEATDANVTNGTYPLARPLLMVVKGAPAPSVRHFVDYALSSCQKIVGAHGYVPARSVN